MSEILRDALAERDEALKEAGPRLRIHRNKRGRLIAYVGGKRLPGVASVAIATEGVTVKLAPSMVDLSSDD